MGSEILGNQFLILLSFAPSAAAARHCNRLGKHMEAGQYIGRFFQASCIAARSQRFAERLQAYLLQTGARLFPKTAVISVLNSSS